MQAMAGMVLCYLTEYNLKMGSNFSVGNFQIYLSVANLVAEIYLLCVFEN